MATSRKVTLLRLLVLSVLAARWVTCVHCRMVPGDYDMDIHDVQASGKRQRSNEYVDVQSSDVDAVAFAASKVDSPWKGEWAAFYYTGAGFGSGSAIDGLDVTSESPSCSARKNRELLEAQDSTEEGFDLIEAGDELGINSPSEESQEAFKNDDVFFDTSSAGTVYKSSGDDEFSVEAAAAGSLNGSGTADAQPATQSKAQLVGCGTGNPIDDCWRCDPNWRSNRQSLASCAVGFGRNAVGGKNGPIYVVTSNADDPENPNQGTLRHAVTREGPQWIIFESSMTIKLKGELMVSAYKTIDARGAEVHITEATQISVQSTNNVIIHGLHIHDVRKSGTTTIRVSPEETKRVKPDGDAIRVWESRDVWIDHCYLARAIDGLVDVTYGSTGVTISNCVLEDQDKVMLLGSSGDHDEDRDMRVTVAFNRFGSGLVQRMPRCRLGVFHVVNNDYSSGWGKYAIGGSDDPTILSQGNLFNATGSVKEVTKRIDDDGPTSVEREKWNWASNGDVFLNGAYFTGSGANATSTSVYAEAYSMSSRPGSLVPELTQNAGPIEL